LPALLGKAAEEVDARSAAGSDRENAVDDLLGVVEPPLTQPERTEREERHEALRLLLKHARQLALTLLRLARAQLREPEPRAAPDVLRVELDGPPELADGVVEAPGPNCRIPRPQRFVRGTARARKGGQLHRLIDRGDRAGLDVAKAQEQPVLAGASA